MLLIRMGLCGVFVVLGAVLFGASDQKADAAAGVNQQINFQARLLNAQGATVPDGSYNIQFKIYQDGDGCVVSGTSPCNGTLQWTESWLNNNTQGVTVKNGYFSVYLGSISSLSAVDFNQDNLWLSLNIGTINGTCTPFTNCGGDGEMLPFKRFASNPYALNSGKLGGRTSSQFVQIAPGAVQADTSAASTIFLNKDNASGNILQLQKAASDVFVVSNSGTTAINTNSVTALTVQNGSNNALGVDTSNIKVAIGLATSSASSRLGIAGQGLANGVTLGDGAAGSANLYVSANDTLKTDDSLIVVGSISTLGSSSVTSGGAFVGPTSSNTINGLIVNAAALSGITSISLSGAISGGTTYSGSGDITSTGGSVIAATHTGSGAVTVSSGGSSALTVTSASGTAILGGTTNTLQRTNATFALDVVNAGAASTLNVTNSDGSQVAHLDVEGGLNIGSGQTYKIGSTQITSAALSNDSNLAKLNGTQTFTGTNTFQPTTNITSLVVKQNSSGSFGQDVFNVQGSSSGNFIQVTSTAANQGAVTIASLGAQALTLQSGNGTVTLGSSTGLTATGALTVSSGGSSALSLDSASGSITIASGDAISSSGQITTSRNGSGTGDSSLAITGTTVGDATSSLVRIGGSIAGGSASGTYLGINAASGFGGNLVDFQTNGASRLKINSFGDITSTTSATGDPTGNASPASIGSSTSMTLSGASPTTTNFNIGNYIRIASTNCGGSGVSVCYAKVTAKTATVLTISPALTWANNTTVTEYHVAEIGGIDTSQALDNRFGRGYFIAGVVTGNGTTYYNENEISTSVASFDLLSEVGTINIGASTGANTINIGTTGQTTTNINGALAITGSFNAGANTITGNGSGLTNLNATNLVQGTGAVTLQSGAGTALTITANAASTFSTSSGALTIQSGSGTVSLGTSTAIAANAALTVQSGGSSTLSFDSASGVVVTAAGDALNAAAGLNTGAGNGTQRIDANGALSNITSISLNGAISGGTTYSGSGDITSTGGSVVAATHTGSGAVTVSSGGSSALTLTSASGTAILGGTTNTLQRTNSAFALDVVNAGSASTLNVTNSNGSQVANLDVEGGLNIGSGQTYKINNADINTAGTLSNVAYENQANTFTLTNTFQPTTNVSSVVIKQNSSGSFGQDVFSVQGSSSGNFIQVTSTAANQGAVTIASLGAQALTLQSGSGTVTLGTSTGLTAAAGLTVSSGGSSALTLDSASGVVVTAAGDSLNAASGLNTGAGNGTQRIDANGALSNITSIMLNGAISGGTTYSGSGDITSTGGSVIAATHTGSGAVAVSSGGSSALTLTSASGTAILGGSTNTVQRTNSTFALDIVNAGAASALNVINSNGSQVANLDVEGGLNIGSGQTYKINSADINTAGTLTNVAYENQANIFTAAQSLQITNGSALLIQNNGGGATLLTADTSAMIIKIGTTSAGTLSGVDLTVAEAEVTTTLRVGTTSNGMDFSASGVTYYGVGANVSRRIVLSPEYPGATLSPDTTSNVGTMTSDSERATANNWRNFYNWVSTQAGNQDYDILVRVVLPADFGSWETGSCPGSTCALEVEYRTGLAATTNNGVSGLIYNASSDTAVCTLAEAASTSWASFGCPSTILDDGGTDLDTAGQVAIIRLTLKANSTASSAARAGDIVLRYKAKY